MKRFSASLCLLLVLHSLIAQISHPPIRTRLPMRTRPPIVIGLVVDQMRWDYLVRFRDRFGKDGFRRLMEEGFSCDNTMIDYSPSVTACGHTCIYTGSVPALTGIIGNDWYDRWHRRRVYCTDDSTVHVVGADTRGSMSPVNLLTTTIGDELNMADHFTSRVVGIALKDRAAILPAGHTATAAFWFDDKTGHFITSSYYMDSLPDWMQRFNSQSNMTRYTTGNPSAIRTSPAGDALTLDLARTVIEGYALGGRSATDILAISLSSPDGVGHAHGPNSAEIEDIYLQLDQQLAAFFGWLDHRYGKDNYLFFLTADHGVAPSPAFSLAHRMPGGAIDTRLVPVLNDSIYRKWGVTKGIEYLTDGQLWLDRQAFQAKGIPLTEVEDYIAAFLEQVPGITAVYKEDELASAIIPAILKNKLINGYYPGRSGDLLILTAPGWKAGGIEGADHGTVYPFDTHIPLLFMGWKIRPGRSSRPVAMTDIAPTLAALLEVQQPSGCIGRPIEEILKK